MEIIIICIILFVIFLIYTFIQNFYLKVTKYTIRNDKIPKEFNNYKIMQLSDIHNRRLSFTIKRLLKIIKSEKPDIVVITGDFIDTKRTPINEILDTTKKIIGLVEVYYAPGNHEAVHLGYNELAEGFKKMGVNVLHNENALIKKDGKYINLLGIKDPKFYKSDDYFVIQSNINRIKYDKKLYTIMLSHRPDLLDIYASKKIDLVFTGHAHGGQFRVPFIGGLYAPNQGVFPKYTNGIHVKDETTMIVNRGVGNSGFPFRLNNRAEVVVVTLKK